MPHLLSVADLLFSLCCKCSRSFSPTDNSYLKQQGYGSETWHFLVIVVLLKGSGLLFSCVCFIWVLNGSALTQSAFMP